MSRRPHLCSTLALAATILALAACAGGPPVERGSPRTPPAATGQPTEPAGSTPNLEPILEEERQALGEERIRSIQYEQELLALRRELAVAEERYAALELELESTLEELLRSKSSVRSVQNRALATSRIAEVRVSIQSLEEASEPIAQGPLDRAIHFLERADAELQASNYNGAAYLAERASDLVRQSRTTTGFRPVTPTEPLTPLMPPLNLRVTADASVRGGPAMSFDRVDVLSAGQEVLAVAASGDWQHVESEEGLRGWVHSRLLAASASADGESLPAEFVELVSSGPVNLRLGPGVDHAPVAFLDGAETVRGITKVGEWYRVERSNGDTGWVPASYLKPAPPS